MSPRGEASRSQTPHLARCGTCGGEGVIGVMGADNMDMLERTCPQCGGKGVVDVLEEQGNGGDLAKRQRWDPSSSQPATRAQVKEEWRLHIRKQLEEYGPLPEAADNFARDLADEFVEYIAEAIRRATGQALP